MGYEFHCDNCNNYEYDISLYDDLYMECNDCGQGCCDECIQICQKCSRQYCDTCVSEMPDNLMEGIDDEGLDRPLSFDPLSKEDGCTECYDYRVAKC